MSLEGQQLGEFEFLERLGQGEMAAGYKARQRSLKLEAIAIAIPVGTTLAYRWRKATLIHPDIKPDTIFLPEDGGVRLGDLGPAMSAGPTRARTVIGQPMGTPQSTSPEQVRDRPGRLNG